MHAQRDLLHVQHDVGHVLAHARDGGEFVQHALDLNRGHGRALQRRQQHAAQRVAQRQTEAAFQRFGGDRRGPPRIMAGFDLELLRLDQFLPVLLKHFVLIVSRTCRITPFSFDGLVFVPKLELNAAPLGRPATIMRDRRHIADRRDRQANGL